MRKIPFVSGEYYHIYNRGVEKRDIFCNAQDLNRFGKSLTAFNTHEPIGSIFEESFKKKQQPGDQTTKGGALVEIVAFCLNPNHYHLILRQKSEEGIQKFMQRLGTGYTMYFNNKYKRSGILFQGKFKAKHVASNEYLLHLSAYVNLNDKVHQLGGSASKCTQSSWRAYTEDMDHFVNPEEILGQFKNKSEYKEFATRTVGAIIENRRVEKDLTTLFFD